MYYVIYIYIPFFYILCIYIYIYFFSFYILCIYISGLNITFFKVRTNCPEETMLHRTRWISDSTWDNFFLKESRTSRVCVALKTTWSYCTLTNIKVRWVFHRIEWNLISFQRAPSLLLSYVFCICFKGKHTVWYNL